MQQNILNVQQNKPRETTSQNQNKEFYNNSVLKFNSLAEMCHDISNTEILDINVEKFLSNIADNYVESILDTACQMAKHKKSDVLTVSDIAFAMDKNFQIYEPSRATQTLNRIKSNEIKNISTADHKKRVELTREECKNIN